MSQNNGHSLNTSTAKSAASSSCGNNTNTDDGSSTCGGSGRAQASSSIGHYELKKTLGKGSFSTVKLAHHKITRHSVAIKIVKFSVLSEDNLKKINREIEVLKKVGKHGNIVRLYQVIKTKRYFFLVTEYCPDGELYDYLVERGRLSEQQSCKYFLQILSAVEFLHDHNVVHRDLKAENLLLTNNHETVKIADFGFANHFKQDNLLSTWCGSPPYAAPELFKGLHYIGPPVDIWSVGVILYVLVCGSLPFDGHNLVHLKGRVLSGKYRIPFFMSTECESLIKGMLRLDSEKRFSIRQIRSHNWIKKYGNFYTKVTSSPVSTTNKETDANNLKNLAEGKKSIAEGYSGDRDQSLDIEEDRKENEKTQSKTVQSEDESMLCMQSANGYDSVESSIILAKKRLHLQNGSTIKHPAKMGNFVDNEIANAVSNMSIDSNNSSMSVSQSTDQASVCMSSAASSRQGETQRADNSSAISMKHSSMDSSIDDQIIDFMVDNLKMADNQNIIRHSIANEKYDDLHAVYRLLKDQPDIVIEARSRISSLPLISMSTNNSINRKKPSITAGFFNPIQLPTRNCGGNSMIKNTPNISTLDSSLESAPPKAPCQEVNNHPNTFIPPLRDSIDTRLAQVPDRAPDYHSSNRMTLVSQQNDRSSNDQMLEVTPQLFLTPPTDNRSQIPTYSEEHDLQAPDQVDSSSVTSSARQNVARHSFDSTVNHRYTNALPYCMQPTTPLMLRDGYNDDNHAGSSNECCANCSSSQQMVQNLATITTNLPQIGAQQYDVASTMNHNLLLAQLSSPVCTTAMTQSGVLTQNEPTEQRFQSKVPIEFTPNNLVNQNYAVMNNLALQNALKPSGVLNSSLLDPDGLITGFERRASDGQASYSSLTTTTATSNSNNSDNIIRPNPVDQMTNQRLQKIHYQPLQCPVRNMDTTFSHRESSRFSVNIENRQQQQSISTPSQQVPQNMDNYTEGRHPCNNPFVLSAAANRNEVAHMIAEPIEQGGSKPLDLSTKSSKSFML